MQNCYPQVIEKSFEIIKRFEEKFGSVLFSNRYKERCCATGLSDGICGRESEGQIDFCLSISEEVNGQDTLNRRRTRSFRGSGSGTLINRIWSQIPFPSISRTRTMFLTGWLVT